MYNITVGEGYHNKVVESSLAEGNTVLFSLYSGSNVHMRPHLDDLSEPKSTSKKCTSGNN